MQLQLTFIFTLVACFDDPDASCPANVEPSTCSGDAVSISLARDVAGYDAASLRHAVYGAADISVDFDHDGMLDHWSILKIFAADRPDFCDEVLDGYSPSAFLDSIDASVSGTFLDTTVITARRLTSDDVLSNATGALVTNRFSVSDGEFQAVGLDARDLGFTTNAVLELEQAPCGQPLTARLQTAFVDGISIVIDLNTGTITSSPLGEDNPVQATFCGVPECPRLTAFIQSFDSD